MYSIDKVDIEQKKIVGPVLKTSFIDNRQAEEVPIFFHKIMEDEDLERVPNRINANQICAFVKPPESPNFDYYMAVEVSNFDTIPEGMDSLTIPACRCATVSLVKRGNADVMKALQFMTQEWMPAHRCKSDFSLPAFMYYDERFLPIFKEHGYAGDPVAQLFIPIQELDQD